MKKLINRLICLCRGHKWEQIYSYRLQYKLKATHECTRCEKVKDIDMKNLWIARDKNRFLRLFGEEPYKNKKGNEWEPIIGSIWLNDSDFPEVTWENSPQQVELKLKEGNGEVGI